jgi:hypothetical protein
MKKQTAAQELGLISRRYEFGLYPTAEQKIALLDQAAMVRTLQNALNAICIARFLRKSKDAHAYTPYLLRPDVMDDPAATAHPKATEMSRWVTGLLEYDPRWRAMSTVTGHRIVQVVDRSWKAFFREIKNKAANPEAKNTHVPRRKTVDRDGAWVPYVHLKRKGDIGSSGSGCKMTHLAGRNWTLALKGIEGDLHCRGQLPGSRGEKREMGSAGSSDLFTQMECGRFIDADVKLVCGKWKLSICIYLHRERRAGCSPTKIKFDLIEGMVRVDGRLIVPDGIAAAQVLQDDADRMQSDMDLRWPKRAPQDEDWRAANMEITRLKSKVARLRRNALHVWSTRVVRDASELTITAPKMRESTKSARGDVKSWGAAVKTVAKLNRNTLSYAPAMAQAMLKYKAEEAGIRCEVIEDRASEIAVGEKLVAAGKQLRKIKRAIKENDNERYQQGTRSSGRSDRRRLSASSGSAGT